MRRLPFLIAALGALLPAGAPAQVDTPIDAIRRMHGVAYCIVYRESQASGILAVPPGSAAERALLRRIATPTCTGNIIGIGLDYQPQMLRGTIAEEVLRLGDNNRSDGRRMGWVAPFAVTAADVAALHDRGRASLQALDFAQCVQAAAPAAVAALLETRPTDSPEERAFQQLMPHLGPCFPAGAEMSISRPQLRGFLAEAACRAAYAASRRAAASNGE